jgi:predicted dehydrogenase
MAEATNGGRAAAPLGVGVVGLGFMGRTHLAAYAAARELGFAHRLVAVADPDPERRAGRLRGGGNIDTGTAPAFDPTEVTGHATAEELFADPRVELVSLCTPTDTHVDLAIAALEAGKHVLVEKPVGTSAREVGRLAHAVEQATTLCMPAMCIRFWPGWTWLAARVRDGRLGRLRGLSCTRLAARPDWSAGFYGDERRTGGALFDLHVHDADLAVHLFGLPDAVSANGDRDHLNVLYHYGDGPRVALEGGWDHDPATPFQMAFRAVFEHGTAEYDSRRPQPLSLCSAAGAEFLELPGHSGYDGEVRALLAAIAAGAFEPPATVAEAVRTTQVLEATAQSMAVGRSVTLS